MPLENDGQILLNPATGNGDLKRAMLVRFTEESLEALCSQITNSDPKLQFPLVQFTFQGARQGIEIGDRFFPVTASGERDPQELYRRQVKGARSDLRHAGSVTGTFNVKNGEVTERTRTKAHDRTVQAESEKSKRQTMLLSAAPELPAGKKRKVSQTNEATPTPSAFDRLTAVKDSARPSPRPSGSAPVSTTGAARPAQPAARSISSQPGSRPGPKLNKSAAAAPTIRSRDAKKPGTSKAKVKDESSGEPDDLPLAITAKKLTKTAGVSSSRASGSAAPPAVAIKRETAATPSLATSKSRDLHQDVKKPVAVSGSSAPSSTSRPSTTSKKQTTDPAKRKRPTDGDDEEYEGPGAKKRKATVGVAVPTATKTLTGKKSATTLMKKESGSPPTPPPPQLPPTIKLARATDEPTLAPGLKFKKHRKTEETSMPLTPPVSTTALATTVNKPATTNGSANGHYQASTPGSSTQSRPRRNTPTFTSTEDEGSDEDEAEEGEVRPAKKRKVGRPSSSSRPPQAIWKPLDVLPAAHDALRLRYAETYAEFTSLGKTFAAQRYLNMRQLQDDGKVADWEAAETLDEDALLRLKTRHTQVCAELSKIKDAYKPAPSPTRP
ncbi:hypothetical protein BKA62DRAFT_681605 [Auriculariales sp. MPI-PUGE-AT-0066]|nr:hypothetical protein BKA62DRAFT_681605 [Auriculariales sp. MPI-PUGE-AT-0066]